MRIFRALLLLWAVVALAIHAFGKDAIESPATEAPKTVGANQTIAGFFTAAITKPSPGRFNYGIPMNAWQTNGTGWGRSAEYRKKIWRRNFIGVLFSDTPTNATLYVPRQKPFTWPIRRYEFDVLMTHEFAQLRHRVVPYLASGAGAIALNGHADESGWDKQAALVAGAGSDVRLWRAITLRAGFTVDGFKASTYSDQRYSGSYTVMVEPRIGFVYDFGFPRGH
jgi:hypothetical protein